MNQDTTASVDTYAQAAMDHTAATRKGDHQAANKAHDVLAALYRSRRARGLDAQRELLPLLDHPEAGVRSWAAYHALEFAPDRAVPILEEIAKAPGLVGFSAMMTLSEFRAGRLKFP